MSGVDNGGDRLAKALANLTNGNETGLGSQEPPTPDNNHLNLAQATVAAAEKLTKPTIRPKPPQDPIPKPPQDPINAALGRAFAQLNKE
jgi:hypothetical protein